MGNGTTGPRTLPAPIRLALLTLTILAATLAGASPAAAAPPANDNRADADPLGGETADVSSTNFQATKDAGEPNHAGDPGGASVWWAWTAPQRGVVTIDTCASDFDTLLAVYRETAPDVLDQERANDDTAGCGDGTQSRVQFTAIQGRTYLIAVDGAAAETGAIELALSQAPLNDTFANATKLSDPTPIIVSSDNRNATKEAGEPDHAGDPGGASVWYRWTPPATGEVVLDACFPNFDTVLAVYRGSAVNDLTQVSANDDNPDQCSLDPNGSLITFKAFKFVTYWIAVDGSSGAQGDFAIALSHFPDPKLAVSVGGIGVGSVTSSPAGIKCGNGHTACTSGFSIFSSVTLKAHPAAGSVFDHWSGACSGAGACEVQMNGSRSVGAVFKPATRRPDSQIKLNPGGLFVGDDVYNATGAGQTAAVTAPAGTNRNFVFRLENDGDAIDTIEVQGCSAATGFSVAYRHQGTDVTAAVQAGTQQFVIGPGGSRTIGVSIASQLATATGSIQSCSIRATSANGPAKSDTVVARLKVA